MSALDAPTQTARLHRKTVAPPASHLGVPRSAPATHLSREQQALQRGARHLLSLQQSDGHWCAELQGDTILESEFILLMAFLGREGEDKVRKAGNYILSQQRPEGAWSNYPGGPVDVTVSVKAYFALKLTGHDVDAPYMRRARDLILQGGGAENVNSFTKFYLAFLGQFPYDSCATVPPEIMLLPEWFYFHLHSMSSWTRTIVVPLSIFSAHKPVRRLPPEKCIPELFRQSPWKNRWPHEPSKRLFTAHNLFLALDQVVKLYEKWGPRWLRKKAVDKAAQWLTDHFQDSDGVGAIFPPIIYTVISLHCLGYAADSPEMLDTLAQLDALMIEEGDTVRLQPCFSPVWDTALAINTLAMAGLPGAAGALRRGGDWLLSKEVRRRGDWSVLCPEVEAGGWFFEYRNAFYPDVDDTAMVLMGLARSGQAWETSPADAGRLFELWRTGQGLAERRPLPAVRRGIHWLLGLQNSDGGWAAFDKDINKEILTQVPFADHNAMLDPSCPDITARALEALGQFGYRPGHPQVDRAVAFIQRTQDPRGCWIGRWGVNYIYGTWQVLVGLEAIGLDMQHPMVRKAVAWLKQVQQANGGWGESCHTYDDPRTAGQGNVTASQTGWALLGLLAAGERSSSAVQRGIDHLVAAQQLDGSWHEDEFTGTGFPKVFYLKYHYYRLYFPIMALARYLEGKTAAAEKCTHAPEGGYQWHECEPVDHA